MFKIIEVSKSYQMGSSTVQALDKISVDVPNGQFVAITGPSGCGKSTLLYTIGGLLTPTNGKIFAEETDIYKLTHKERARFRRENIGFVFQTFELIPYLTALENVMLPLALSKVDDDEQVDLAKECLDKVGLGNRAYHKPTELSGGEQQRVALARGIINSPRILLADEPTGNLDKRTGEEIIHMLKTLNKEGLTIIMVTHDLTKAENADRILSMLDGSLRVRTN
jgi:putative ABC transport system ATP-binding protein